MPDGEDEDDEGLWNRKISVGRVAIYVANLASSLRYADVGKIWREWTKKGTIDEVIVDLMG